MKFIPSSVVRFCRFVVKGEVKQKDSPLSGGALLKKAAFVLLFFVAISSTVSFSQIGGGTGPSSTSSSTGQVDQTRSAMTSAEALAQVGSSIERALCEVGGSCKGAAPGDGRSRLNQIGWSIFGFFLAANIVWVLLKGMLASGGMNSFFADLVPALITAGVVIVFMSPEMGVGDAIISSIATIGEVITGAGMKSLDQLIVGAGSSAFDAILNVFSIPAAMASRFTFWEILGWLPVYLLALIPIGLSIFFILIALVLYLGILVTSQISVSIALIFAPIFVPFLMFRPASFLFDGWLRFLLGASLMKVIGLLVNQFSSAILGKMADISVLADKSGAYSANMGLNGFGVDIVLFGTMILLSGLAAMMMLQVPSIALGLISGNASGAGFSGLGGLAKMSGGRVLVGDPPRNKNSNGSSGLAGRMTNHVREQAYLMRSVEATGKGVRAVGRSVAGSRMGKALSAGFKDGRNRP